MAEIDLKKAAQQPKEMTQDGRTVRSHTLAEQILADEYLSRKKAAKRSPERSIRVSKPIGNGAW